MNIPDVIEAVSCEPRFHARTKDEALRALARLAANSPALEAVGAEPVYEALAKRESQGSTGFGNEIALPHARIPGLARFVVFAVSCPRGIPFDALDKKKVKLLFVILAPPDAVTQHLRVLATISRAIGHTTMKKELLAARSAETMAETIIRNLGDPAATAQTAPEVMKLMLINLYVEEYLYDVLEMMVELGIEGATILESTGMGRYVSSVPIFAEFIGFMKESKNFSKTIIAMVPDRHVQKVIEGVEEVTGDLDKHDGAAILVLDVGRYKGSMRMM